MHESARPCMHFCRVRSTAVTMTTTPKKYRSSNLNQRTNSPRGSGAPFSDGPPRGWLQQPGSPARGPPGPRAPRGSGSEPALTWLPDVSPSHKWSFKKRPTSSVPNGNARWRRVCRIMTFPRAKGKTFMTRTRPGTSHKTSCTQKLNQSCVLRCIDELHRAAIQIEQTLLQMSVKLKGAAGTNSSWWVWLQCCAQKSGAEN